MGIKHRNAAKSCKEDLRLGCAKVYRLHWGKQVVVVASS